MTVLAARYLRRDAALGASLLRASVKKPSLPLKLTVCLTFRCHHRCASCGIWSRSKGDEMSAAQLDRLFASVPGLNWLDLTGGEISVRRDLPQIAASLRKHLPKLAMLHFPTGGWSPDATLAAAQMLSWRAGPRLVVTVSIDGPPTVHDRLRGVAGAWDRAVESLLRLRRHGIDCYAGFTLQPGNLECIDETVAALGEALPGFDHGDLHVNIAHESEHYFANTGSSSTKSQRSSTAAIASQMAAFQRRKGPPGDPLQAIEYAYLHLLQDHFRHGRSPIPCRSGELSAYIAPDGEVFACTIDPRPIGHLAGHGWSLASLWQTAARTELAADIAADRCVGCWTPCEAYQTLLASPRAVVQAMRG